MPLAWNRPQGAAAWAVFALGLVIALIGLTLLIGGVWLIAVGGSWYYAIAGLVALVSGGWLMNGDRRGAYLYLALYVGTLIWSLWEVGLDGWGLVPRLAGASVLLVLVLASLLVLSPDRTGRRAAWGGLGVFVVLLILGGFGVAHAAHRTVLPVPEPGTASAAPADDPLKPGADWPAYGGTYAAQRYSPLAQITTANVGRLKKVWTYHTGDLPPGRWGAETTPLKIGDTVYLCSARNRMMALDAGTGRERWRYDPHVPDAYIPYTAACRGVSYYAVPGAAPTTPCAARIIEGTLDARLIAVDARTGAPCQSFGQGGQVDTSVNMGRYAPGIISITSAPTIVRGVVVTGHQILDGQMRWAASGVIQGYDAVDGRLRWAWDMMRPDIKAPPPAGQIYTPGTPNMWTTATGDEALGLVYLPLGNSAADYWSSLRRPLENRYSSSLVALDVTTGKPAWSFQTVHKDVWDYDLGSQGTLVDFPTASGPVPAIVLPSKQGDIYVLDRRTGRPLTGVAERPVPQGGVEPQQRSPTQPFSLYHTLRKPDLTEASMWGMSPIDQMICRIQFRQASYKGFYTPPEARRHSVEYPSYNGGSDWGGIAIDPRRGLIVANYNDMPNYNLLVPRAVADKKGWFPRGDPRTLKQGGRQGQETAPEGAEGAGDPQAGTPYAIQVNAGWRMPFTKLLCKEPPYGGIAAIDLRTGRTLWDEPLGTAVNNGPFGIPSHLPITIGTPNNGGAVVTAGGLVFIAAATDNLIRAIDIRTGKVVWSDRLPAGGQATPMVYEQNGREYLLIMAAGHHFMETKEGDALVAYAL